ncbi:MAG: acetate--CoA ligase family protein [Rhizobiaceae bacterium]|nr:acetate--CoA ligase family protein [Rhizobiaceae bacterium]
MKRDLSRLLRPKSIALVGGAWAENVIIQLQKAGYDGEIWPVHPKRDAICGIRCFKTLDELPSAPDASFIGVNRELSVEVVRQLSAMGAGGATCFASGFQESDAEGTGGADLQNALVKAAGDMPIIGPNCYGLINYLDNVPLWPDQHGARQCERGVALIGQSSNILINMTMQKRGLPIAYALAVGNQAQTSLSDLAIATLEDERVTAVGLYIEGFGNLREFEAMATRARELGKPIVAIKSGKSEKSRVATMTHTASLAGGAAASSAFLKRLGITEVQSIAVFLETLKLFHQFGPLGGNAISSMSCSGGEAGLISDMVEGSAINFRDLSPIAHKRLKEVLGPIVTVANPLDYHTFIWSDYEALKATYSAVFADKYDLNILIMDIPPTERCDMSAWEIPLQAAIDAKCEVGAKVALHATLPENLSEEISDRLMAEGIVPMHGMDEMVAAIDAAIGSGTAIAQSNQPVLLVPEQNGNPVTLDEAQSKAALARHGLSFPKSASATTPEEISEASQALEFPLALKGLGIAHKSEAGAVVLNLKSAEAVKQAAISMKGVSGFLVEEMVSTPVVEILVGITRDATGLFLLTIGAGGVLTELLEDTASLIIPASEEEISAAFDQLKIAKLLNGYRGKPAADKPSLIKAVLAIQDYCLANPHLLELDINPLMALPDKAIAVDALIIQENQSCPDP